MRLPRDVSGDDLAKALAGLGYRVTRQTGSHLRLTTLDAGRIFSLSGTLLICRVVSRTEAYRIPVGLPDFKSGVRL